MKCAEYAFQKQSVVLLLRLGDRILSLSLFRRYLRRLALNHIPLLGNNRNSLLSIGRILHTNLGNVEGIDDRPVLRRKVDSDRVCPGNDEEAEGNDHGQAHVVLGIRRRADDWWNNSAA